MRQKKKQRKKQKMLKPVDLETRINYCPFELSGGEQQCIAIARALINILKIILATSLHVTFTPK
jgi:ABC-type lipoprotein export system ATPase subunit